MESEEFEDFLQEERAREILEVTERELRFSQGCNEAYLLLERHGVECIDQRDPEESEEALNRMIGYFTQMEEYEKCSKIKEVYQQIFKKDPTPIFPNFYPE